MTNGQEVRKMNWVKRVEVALLGSALVHLEMDTLAIKSIPWLINAVYQNTSLEGRRDDPTKEEQLPCNLVCFLLW